MIFFERDHVQDTGWYTWEYIGILQKDQRKILLVSNTRNSYLWTFIKGGDVLQTGKDGASFEMSAFEDINWSWSPPIKGTKQCVRRGEW